MKKTEKHLVRLMALLLTLPLLLTAAFSFAVMAEAVDPQLADGTVILEDPAFIGNIEEDLSEVVFETESTAPPATEPTATPTDAPTEEPTEAPTEEPSPAPTEVPNAAYEIVMAAPKGWYLNRAAMEVTITDAGGTGWSNVRITMGGNTLINGALPSGHLWIDLLDNCTVEVVVTDHDGNEHKKSVAIACFDKTRPNLKASVKNESLHIEAADEQSGVSAVQVNGTTYTELDGGKLVIPLRGYADAYEQFLVQAVDKVGNVSKAIAVANPFFHHPPTAAPKPTAAPTKKPSGGGSSGGNHSGASGSHASGGNRPAPTPLSTATPIPLSTALPTAPPALWPTTPQGGASFTNGGNAFTRDLLYDRYTNKQFIAIETRSGDVLYMVIDYDKPLDEDGDRYETYFLNLVDSRDLLDIVDEDLIEPEIVYVTPEPTAVPTPKPSSVEDAPQSGGGSAMGILGVLAVAGGGALWYFKLRKPKPNAESGFERDYGFDDDEDEEETTDEDE